jgi:hypothetical protein
MPNTLFLGFRYLKAIDGTTRFPKRHFLSLHSYALRYSALVVAEAVNELKPLLN